MGEALPTYTFAIEDVAFERWVEIDIRPHNDAAKQQYSQVWHRLAVAIQEHHKMVPSNVPEWTKWKPQDWCRKPAGYEPRLQYVAWAGSNLVGFLNLWPGFPSAEQGGKGVMYVEHLAAAPGNLDTQLWRRRFGGVGTALLAYAVMVSRDQGFEGRLGLHAATAEAEGFYKAVDEEDCGGQLFYPRRLGIAGPTPRGPFEVDKAYLESRESGALTWLESYRSG